MDDTITHATSRFSRRALLQGGLGLAGAAALAGSAGGLVEALATGGPASASPSIAPLAYQLGWITNTEFAGTYLAQKMGYYEKAGVKVTVLPGGANPVEPVVASGKALVGDSNADIVSAAVAQGAKLRIFGARYQLNPFCIISSAKKPIVHPKQLIGKKVGVNAYNLTAWNVFLKLNHIAASQVTTVNEGFTSGPTPLADGQVDAWMGFITNEPGVLTLAGFKNHTFLMADFGYHVYADVYIATVDSLKHRKQELAAFLKGEREGWARDIADTTIGTDLTYQLYGKKLALSKKQQQLENAAQTKLIVTPYTKSHGLFAMNPADISKNLATLSFASTPAAPYYTRRDLFDSSILEMI